MSPEAVKKELQIRRTTVTINSNTPPVHLAQEQITWEGGDIKPGGVQISGIGSSREGALVSINAAFEALTQIITGEPSS